MPRRVKEDLFKSPQTPGNSPSVVEQTTEAIAFGIVSGKYGAGERLPSVRQLAREFDINPSTVQVVMGRLQASGFVSAHQGLGFIVRDIEQFGGIPTWRYIFRFAQQIPERATKIYKDLLETRLVFIAEAVQKIAENPDHYDPTPVRWAVGKLEVMVSLAPHDLTEIARAELHATRMLVLASGQSVVTALLNSIGEIYLDAPAVVQAMYAEPQKHIALWHALFDQWERGKFSSRAVAHTRELFKAYDVIILERFRKIVTAGAEGTKNGKGA